jgi:hypothetical protein
MPDDDHIWSKHVVSVLSEQILISSITFESSVVFYVCVVKDRLIYIAVRYLYTTGCKIDI